MGGVGREHVFVEGSADGGGEYVGFVDDVAIRVSVQDAEERVEVVRGLVDVEDRNRATRTDAVPEAADSDLHWGHRVFSLRRSIIGNHDRLFSRLELQALNCLLQEGHGQSSTARRQSCMLVV